MKGLLIVGVLLLVLGVLSFIIPIPHHETHGMNIGDAKFSLQTETSEKLPPAVGMILIAGGVVAVILGLNKSRS